MKKFGKLFLIFGLAFMTLIGGAFLMIPETNKNERVLKAEETTDEASSIPDYFTVQKGGASGEKIKELSSILNIGANDVAHIKLDKNMSFAPNLVSLDIQVNGKTIIYNPAIKKDMQDENYPLLQYQKIETYLRIGDPSKNIDQNPDKINETLVTYVPEGKVTFSFNYLEYYGTNFFQNRNREFTFSFYYYNRDTYYKTVSSNLPQANMTNAEDAELSGSATYDINYFFNYNNKKTSYTDTLYLPNLIYNPQNFEIIIRKSFQGLVETVKVSFDGTKSVINRIDSSKDLVLVKTYHENPEDSSSRLLSSITFNDIGEYDITYKQIYFNAQTNSPEYLTDLFAKDQKIFVYGFQLNYTDIESGTLKEFKNFVTETDNAEKLNTLNEQTDISYMSSDFLTAGEVDKTKLPSTVYSTNQAPLQFKFNSKLDTNNSKKYSLSASGAWSSGSSYDGANITDPGTYLLKLVYTYPNYIKNGSSAPGQIFTQYFYFSITSSTPKADIHAVTSGNSIASNTYTNENVQVSKNSEESIFNSKISISVAQYAFNGNTPITTLPLESSPILLTENGRYVTTIRYGKNLSKTIVHSFSIDKTPIQGLTAYNVKNLSSSTYLRNTEVDLFTNQDISIQWNEKESGAATTSYYKFIPIRAGKEPERVVLTYNQKDWVLIPSEVGNFQNLQKVIYQNTINTNVLYGHQLLSTQGIYVIKVTDAAGNSTIRTFIIDKTTPRFLLKDKKGFYSVSTGNITVSEDITVEWGSYKGIILSEQIGNINADKDGDIKYAFDKLVESGHINNYSNNNYLTVKIDPVAYVRTNTYSPITASKWEIPFKNNEGQFMVIIRDESNTLGTELSQIDKYLSYPSAMQKVIVTSDLSGFSIFFEKDNGEKDSILLNNSYQVISDYTPNSSTESIPGQKKSFFYFPTKQDKLMLSFLPEVIEGDNIIQIEYVTLKYYPFKVVPLPNYHYELPLTNEPIAFDIYRFNPNTNSVEVNLTTEKDGLYYYDVYTQTTADLQTLTRPGKYVVERAYTLASTIDQEDFLCREYTFYVDRFNVLSEPTVVEVEADGSITYESVSIVGGEMFIRMFNGVSSADQSLSVDFNNLYTNEQNSPNATPPSLFTSNKVPVKVYIPQYKYVTKQTGKLLLDPVKGLTYFDPDNPDGPSEVITSYELTAKIEHQVGLSWETFTQVGVDENGFLTFSKNEFKDSGIYRVIVSQGYDKNSDAINDNIRSSYVFTFEIANKAPSFNITDSRGNSINSVNNSGQTFYYTNKQNLVIEWSDPRDNYTAKIDKNDINIVINNEAPIHISPSQIQEGANNTYYISLDLKNLSPKGTAYQHDSQINVFMHYEGDSTLFPAGMYSSTKTIKIDLEAPATNINALLLKNNTATGLDNSLLRQYVGEGGATGTSYNISVSAGTYAYYSYTVNPQFVKDMASFVKNNLDAGETRTAYIRAFEGTKYDNNYTQETSYTSFNPEEFELLNDVFIESNFDGDNLMLNSFLKDSSYYEIVEEDTAGNLTIYTIFLTVPNGNREAITYEDGFTIDNNSYKKVLESELTDQVNIYARSSFHFRSVNLSNDAWYNIGFTISGTQYSYVHTPYMKSSQVMNQLTGSIIELGDMYNLIPANYKYNFTLSNRKAGQKIALNIAVTEKLLQYEQIDPSIEYIEIEVPREQDIVNNVAIIYASEIEIRRFNSTTAEYEQIYYSKNNDGRIGSYYSSSDSPIEVRAISKGTKQYVRFKLKMNPAPNTRFKYTFSDNYGQKYEIIHDFQETVINNPITGESSVYQKVSGSDTIYVSTNIMYYEYNTNKYIVKLFQKGIEEDTELDTGSIGSVIKKITIGENRLSQNSMYYILKYENRNNEISGEPLERIYFQVYNIYPIPGGASKPNLTITDKNNSDITNALLNATGVFSGPVTIRYTDTSTYDYPVIIELAVNGKDFNEIPDGTIIEEPGEYTIRIRYAHTLTDFIVERHFVLSDALVVFYYVAYDETGAGDYIQLSPTGKPYSYANGTKTIGTHYIVNTQDTNLVKIVTNELQGVHIQDNPERYTSGTVVTYIYTLTNTDVVDKPNITWFSKQIAISYVPKTENFVPTFAYFKADGTTESLTELTKTVISTTEEENFRSLRVQFSAYNQIPENKINIIMQKDNLPYVPKVLNNGDISYVDLKESGVYKISFTDVAGNKQIFRYGSTVIQNSDTYSLIFLKNVITLVNDQAPIQNSIYNEDVTISIPISTLEYYDNGARPEIHVKKDGEEYKDFKTNRYTYTFSEPGLYEVYFTAKSSDKPLREEKFIFTIIEENESRLAFEYTEYGDYYIQSIFKDGIDVTQILVEAIDSPKIVINGVTYLKELLVSRFDAKTGTGRYTFTVNTNNEMNQNFSFNFWINNATPPISISVPEGTATTSNITITFNPHNIHDNMGDCILKIGSYSLEITTESLLTMEENVITRTIDQPGTYYIQIYSLSNKLLYSYKVDRTEPLNTVAIIVIVISVIAVIGIVLVFIFLRKRIKVR